MAGLSILIIDDETSWHELIRRLLEGAGYKIYAATDCADGVRLAALHKPDCIILDFHLPDGDAVSVCSEIRANRNIKKIPVIIFSSDPEAETTAYEQCMADSFILKGQEALAELPFTVKRILGSVFPKQSGNKLP